MTSFAVKDFNFCNERDDHVIRYMMDNKEQSSSLSQLTILEAALKKDDPLRAQAYNKLADKLLEKLGEGHVFSPLNDPYSGPARLSETVQERAPLLSSPFKFQQASLN